MADRSDTVNELSTAPQRLLLIANRLPITLTKTDKSGTYSFEVASGGLVTGLSGLQKTTKFKWFGWPGKTVPEVDIAEVERGLAEKYDAIPIWVESGLMDLHYNKYSSELVIICVHSFSANIESRCHLVAYLPLPRK